MFLQSERHMEVQQGRQMLRVSWREELQLTAQQDILELLLQEELQMPEACQACQTEWTRLLQALARLCQGAISRLLHVYCWPGTLLSWPPGAVKTRLGLVAFDSEGGAGRSTDAGV